MKITFNHIKDIVLVVAILVIIGLILFKKDPDPIIIDGSAERIEQISNKIDSLESNVNLIYITANDEKNIIDSVTGKHSIDSLLTKHFGFASK